MRRRDDTLDPVVERELDALDAALRGEPVGPEDTELAELALLLVAEAPRPPAEFCRELDDRAAARFGEPESPRRGGVHAFGGGSSGAGRRFSFNTLAGLVIATVLVLGVVVAGQFGPRKSGKGATTSFSAPASPQQDVAPPQASGAGGSSAGGTAAPTRTPPVGRAAPAPLPFPGPAPGPRKVERAASLTLVARPRAVDRVSRAIASVTRSEGGIVASSNVTTGEYGGGRFQLRIPSSRLQDALARLGQIPGARVQASSNSTLDITGSFNSAQRRVQELEAQRVGLLKSLANASTLSEIDSIKAQLRIVNAKLRAAHARLDAVRTRAAYSTVSVELITSRGGPVPTHKGGGGGSFTPGRAWHDALRILSVSAAVLLVSLAALLPIALILLLAWWARRTAARRRREQALDAV